MLNDTRRLDTSNREPLRKEAVRTCFYVIRFNPLLLARRLDYPEKQQQVQYSHVDHQPLRKR